MKKQDKNPGKALQKRNITIIFVYKFDNHVYDLNSHYNSSTGGVKFFYSQKEIGYNSALYTKAF